MVNPLVILEESKSTTVSSVFVSFIELLHEQDAIIIHLSGGDCITISSPDSVYLRDIYETLQLTWLSFGKHVRVNMTLKTLTYDGKTYDYDKGES